MNTHQHLHTSFYAPEAADHFREWLTNYGWNIGITIQPCNPRYTVDDMDSLGSDVINDLTNMLRIRHEPLVFFVREQSRGERLWHLHGLMRVKSNKRFKWMMRHGADWIRESCDLFADGRGSLHSDPSVHIFAATSEDSSRFLSYINKDSFRNPDSDRYIIGLSQ